MRGRTVLLIAAASLLLSACIHVGGDAPPKAVGHYLDALRAGDYHAAYERTQLASLSASFGPGASVSFDHFKAFFQAHPLKGYSVKKVTRIDHRTLQNAHEPGTPLFVVDVDLTYGDGTKRSEFSVEGDIVGVVTIDPDRVIIATQNPITSVAVDGVLTPVVAQTAHTYALLMLSGVHSVRASGETVVIETNPTTVRSGPGRIEKDQYGQRVVVFE